MPKVQDLVADERHNGQSDQFSSQLMFLADPFSPKVNMDVVQANIHMDAGLFGYYPLVDRAKGMYMQIATAAWREVFPVKP